MSKLKPGTWCRPSSEKEWRLILDLAEELGMNVMAHDSLYERYPCLCFTGSNVVSQCRDESESRFSNDRIPVPEFLSGMYGLAKEKSETVGEKALKEQANFREMAEYWKKVEIELKAKAALAPLEKRVGELEEKIKALEQKERMIEFNKHYPTAVSDMYRPIVDPARVRAQADRIQSRNGSPVYQYATNSLGAFVVQQGWKHDIGDDHGLFIDPNASPRDIPFSVALEYLKAGRRIARRGWMGSISITERLNSLRRQDILANDWCVLPLDK